MEVLSFITINKQLNLIYKDLGIHYYKTFTDEKK
jgi:hypothetical protein